jgi:hypothetical protein
MNDEPAMPNIVAGGEGRVKHNSWQMDGSLNDSLFT